MKRTFDDINTGNQYLEYVDPMNDAKKMKIPLDNAIYTVGNEIHFTCGIDKTSIEEVIKQMTKLIVDQVKEHGDDPFDLVYIVDSPGGSVTSILKFVDFIKMTKIKYPFVTFVSIITGMSASAATIMCVIGDKRYMTANAHSMVHELSSGTQGTYSKMGSYMNFLQKLHNSLVDIYCKNTGQTKEVIEDIMMKEVWYGPEEYKRLGFVHDIK